MHTEQELNAVVASVNASPIEGFVSAEVREWVNTNKGLELSPQKVTSILLSLEEKGRIVIDRTDEKHLRYKRHQPIPKGPAKPGRRQLSADDHQALKRLDIMRSVIRNKRLRAKAKAVGCDLDVTIQTMRRQADAAFIQDQLANAETLLKAEGLITVFNLAMDLYQQLRAASPAVLTPLCVSTDGETSARMKGLMVFELVEEGEAYVKMWLARLESRVVTPAEPAEAGDEVGDDAPLVIKDDVVEDSPEDRRFADVLLDELAASGDDKEATVPESAKPKKPATAAKAADPAVTAATSASYDAERNVDNLAKVMAVNVEDLENDVDAGFESANSNFAKVAADLATRVPLTDHTRLVTRVDNLENEEWPKWPWAVAALLAVVVSLVSFGFSSKVSPDVQARLEKATAFNESLK